MAIERMLASKRIYEGKILSLRVDEVQFPNGASAAREVVEHGGAAGVVAFDEDGKLLMVRQYRYPIGQELLELPAGKIDPGETPEQAGCRELEEETGCRCERLTPLGVMLPAAAYLTEHVHLFLAEGLIPSCQNLDENEFLTVERLEFEQAVQMVLSGAITDAKTQIGILKVHALRQ